MNQVMFAVDFKLGYLVLQSTSIKTQRCVLQARVKCWPPINTMGSLCNSVTCTLLCPGKSAMGLLP